MTEIYINSDPDGAVVMFDGVSYGTTPLTITIDEEERKLDMAVFVSPQYKDDVEILAAMRTYIDAVKTDIGWNIGIVPINQSDNRYDTIQTKINKIYDNNPLKACMMVGEDIAEENNVFHTADSRMCQQALPFWQSHGGTLSESCPHKVTVSKNTIRIPTSLIYPNFNDPYNTKKRQIIAAMGKFSRNRGRVYNNDVIAFYDTQFYDADEFGQIFRDELHYIGDDILEGDPQQSVVNAAVNEEHKLVIAAGHGRPDIVHVTGTAYSVFTHQVHGQNVKTPFLLVSGCNAHGWYTEIEDNCLYQPPSNRRGWFGHTIFDNPMIQVVLAGFPIGKHGENIEFVGSGGLYKMSAGKTIAEAMRGIISEGSNCTLFGDPTFHY